MTPWKIRLRFTYWTSKTILRKNGLTTFGLLAIDIIVFIITIPVISDKDLMIKKEMCVKGVNVFRSFDRDSLDKETGHVATMIRL